MIKAIVFDLDGVYFLNGKENFIKSLTALGVSEPEAKRIFLNSEEMKVYKAGFMTDEEFWSWALAEWKLSLAVPQITKLLIDGYAENTEVVDSVKKARAKGYKTLTCTNNFPAKINGLQDKFKFLDNFDAAVLAYEVGALKPDNKMLQELIDRSGVKPEEIFLADDREDTIRNAKELGIEAFFYSDFPGFLRDLKILGVELS